MAFDPWQNLKEEFLMSQVQKASRCCLPRESEALHSKKRQGAWGRVQVEEVLLVTEQTLNAWQEHGLEQGDLLGTALAQLLGSAPYCSTRRAMHNTWSKCSLT